MKYITIDVGTYSVKFIASDIDKKFVILNSFHEIVIKDFLEKYRGEIDEDHLIHEIIRQYFTEKNIEGKIISQLPNNLISTRFTIIPIKNKKKARLTIPFQIEEEIPYPISETSISSILRQHEESTLAYIAFLNRDNYDYYYDNIFRNGLHADIMTIEPSSFQSYVLRHKINSPICIIDIGHTTTKAYLFNNQSLVSTHIAHIAGKSIDESIANAYQISLNEASEYKHQNAFVLTSEQYENVDANQREFAQLMEKVLAPLITEIKRWEIGYRGNFGLKVQNILTTGGTSNLTNMHNFLTEKLGIRVQRLQAFNGARIGKSEFEGDKNLENKFGITSLMTLNMLNKSEMINFKSGIIGQSGEDNIPIHSTSYLATRVFAIALVIILSLFVEKIFINSDISSLDKRIARILKNPAIGINQRTQRQFSRKPTIQMTKTIAQTIKKRNSEIKKQIELIHQTSSVNAIKPLVYLSNILKSSSKTYMTKFSNRENQVRITFKSNQIDEMNFLEEQVKSLDLPEMKTSTNTQKNILNINFKAE